jgi:hypothetical protein
MSTHTEHDHGAGHGHGVRQEEDRISTPAIIGVGVASLIVFIVASLVTGRYWHARGEANGPPVIPPEVGQNKIGMVEQQMFTSTRPFRGERRRAAQLERLSSYGWVDQSAGIAHLPITDAMSLVAHGVRPMPVVPPEVPSLAPPGGQP